MTDEKTRQLENRIDKLESTIEKMMPSRRDALKMGGAALAGGSLMASTASAGTNQVGTIGTSGALVDVNAEDIDAVSVNTGNLNADNVVIRKGTVGSLTEHTGSQVSISPGGTENIFNLGTAVDVLSGSYGYSGFSNVELEIEFGDGTTDKINTSLNITSDDNGDRFGSSTIPPITNVKRLTLINTAGSFSQTVGYEVTTI